MSDFNGATLLLYDPQKSGIDLKKEKNPLLAIIQLKIPAIMLEISQATYVKKIFSYKDYVLEKYECLDDTNSINTTKLVDWKEFKTNNATKSIFYYKILICSNLPREGIIATNGDTLFNVVNQNSHPYFNLIVKTFKLL